VQQVQGEFDRKYVQDKEQYFEDLKKARLSVPG